ncbi:MAG: hypothetical protein WCP95_15020 [Actinomycetes bacterium]
MPDRTLLIDECRLLPLEGGVVGLLVQGWVRGPSSDRPLVVIESTAPIQPIRLLVPLDVPRHDVPVEPDEAAYGFRVVVRGEGLTALTMSEARLIVRSRWAESGDVVAWLSDGPAMGLVAVPDPGILDAPNGGSGVLAIDSAANAGFAWSLGARSTLDHYLRDLALGSSRRRIAVLGHAHDAGGWFPYWYAHYARSVGATNIFVTTSQPRAFADFELGGVIGLEGWAFNNYSRAALHSGVSQGLMSRYESVLLADIDEIVVSSLDYDLPLSELPFDPTSMPGMRPLGFDVAQLPDEPAFNFDARVIDQRRRGVANTGLFKSSLLFVPQFVSIGFHGSSENLKFTDEPLILLHLKRADREIAERQLVVASSPDLVEETPRRYQLESAQVSLPAEEELQSFEEFLEGGFVRRFVERSRLEPFGFWSDDPSETDIRPVDLRSIFDPTSAVPASTTLPSA